MKKIPIRHDDTCPCKAFVLAQIEADGYHRIAVRLQYVAADNAKRAAKARRERAQ